MKAELNRRGRRRRRAEQATGTTDDHLASPATPPTGAKIVAWRWNPASRSWVRITRQRVVDALDFSGPGDSSNAVSAKPISTHAARPTPPVSGSRRAPEDTDHNIAWRWNATTRSWARAGRIGLPGAGPLDRSDVEDRNVILGPTQRATTEGTDVGRQSVTRNISALIAAQMVTWLAAMALSVGQSRFLGPSGIGKIGLAVSLWTVAGVIVTFGTTTLITIEAAKDPAAGAAIAGTSIRFQAFPTAIAFGVLQAYGMISGYDRTTLIVIAVVGGAALFQSYAAALRAFSYGMERMGATSLIDVVHRVAFVMIVIVVLWAGAGPIGSVITNFLVTVSNFVVLTAVLRRRIPIPMSGTVRDYRAILRRSRSYFLNEAIVVVYQQVDVIVISALLTTTALGYYSVSTLLFGTLLFLPNIVATSTFPVLSRLHAHDPASAARYLEKSLGTMMLISGPIIAATIALGNEIISLLYGPKFDDAGPILRLMGLVLVFTIPSITLGRYALVIGRQHAWAVASAIAAVLTVPLDIVLVDRCEAWFDNGAIAGAITFIITEAFLTFFGIVVVAPGLVNRRFGVRLLKLATAMAVMYAVTWHLRKMLIIVPPLAGLAAYLVAVLVMRAISTDEIDAVRQQIRRRLPGRFAS
ncbi:MAG: flippase [Acidimicrobiia bacterium]